MEDAVTRAELPFAVQKAGEITLVVTFEGGSNYAVESEVYQSENCTGWQEVLRTLREQRMTLLATGLPVKAVYYPNESAYSARSVEF